MTAAPTVTVPTGTAPSDNRILDRLREQSAQRHAQGLDRVDAGPDCAAERQAGAQEGTA